MLSIDPVDRLSSTSTSCPSFSRRSARCEPTNPAPPVMSAFTVARILSQRVDRGRGVDVVGKVCAVELERARQSLAQRDPRLPPERLANLCGVGVEVADVDHLLLG